MKQDFRHPEDEIMNSRKVSVVAGAFAATLVASPALGQTTAPAGTSPAAAPVQPPPPAEIEVGRIAPDFTMPFADSSGVLDKPVTLSELRGKVVVLAFYPLDRSSGCTAQLIKFRDEYEKLFGAETVVLPISVDSLSTHASWAKEMKFPFALGSDSDLSIARRYGSYRPGATNSTRTVFVIGKDGRILWRNLRFGALNEGAYSELASEVAKAH
jgi:peroxiredoxin Q/BCP